MANNKDSQQTIREFEEAVNMGPGELEEWLSTEESYSVGQGEGEPKGHVEGRKIVEMLRKGESDYTEEDLEHMEKVQGYVSRHLKQPPKNQSAKDSKWRYSLMNWGHDPLKGQSR